MENKSSTFTYRIVFNLYASVRTNLLPKPGTISLDYAGIFTMINTSNQKIVVQKPLRELMGVRPSQLFHLKNDWNVCSLILYISHNEAYTVTFGSEDPVLNSGIDIYEKILSGDIESASEIFKANDISRADKSKVKGAISQANEDYAHVLSLVKQAGVYKSPFNSAPFIGGILIICIVLLIFFIVYLMFH